MSNRSRYFYKVKGVKAKENTELLSNCCDAPPKSTVFAEERNINYTAFRKPASIGDDRVGTCSACGEWVEFTVVEYD